MIEQLGVLQEPTSLLLTGTSVTDVLTMTAGAKESNTITLATFVNEDSTDRTVSLYWTKNTTDYIIYQGTCGAGQTIEIPLQTKLLANSTARKIRAKASAGNVVTVTLIYRQASKSVPNANG